MLASIQDRSAIVSNSRTTMTFGRSLGRSRMPVVVRLFVTCVVLESIALLTLAVTSLIKSQYDHRVSPSALNPFLIFSIQAIYVTLGFVYFSIDSIQSENVFQFGMALATSAIITFSVCWHKYNDAIKIPFRREENIAILVVIVFQMLYVLLTPWMYRALGYRLYRRVGANARIQRMYRTYQLFFSLLKLDSFICSLLIIMAGIFDDFSTVHIILLALVTCSTVGWTAAGYQGVRREEGRLLWIFLLLMIVQPAFVVYSLAYMLHGDYPGFLLNQFVVIGIIWIIVRFSVGAAACSAWKNFGVGLRNEVFLRQPAIQSPLLIDARRTNNET